ncbi:D-galactarate dehydratase [Sedimentimonas flavescens]|uniref:D-galactarate dehydratase n=1 Tax=Sedimentimonas flavescens TaxID=2851012 RepID=A0ABT2ZWM1_9RHOB|nr:D-galactarate dehydratase [Sedimentimonas flavescens]MCT2540123.1 D-galactarate dehydratase [Sedimentimonas flavescens]MCV2878152.1 D-galactarate dehydratase [Sedimentimonas flavescens]
MVRNGLFVLMIALAGCGRLGFGNDTPEAMPPTIAPTDDIAVSALPVPAGATAEVLDTTSAAERAQAAQVTGQGVRLGVTVASLGDPTQPGFWLKTPLVSAPAKGRVEMTATGASAQVDLIPTGGAEGSGSQMSLPTLRLLGVDLTGLPEVVVYRY